MTPRQFQSLKQLHERRREEASVALLEAEEFLAKLEVQKAEVLQSLSDGYTRFETAHDDAHQGADLSAHFDWFASLRERLTVLEKHSRTGLEVVEVRRKALSDVMTELKILDKFNDGVVERRQAERRTTELQELDEFASQKHQRKMEEAHGGA